MSLDKVLTISAVAAAAVFSAYFYRRKKKNEAPKIWRPVGKVTKIHLYPLKSGRRIDLKSAECTDLGIKQCKNEEKGIQLGDRSFVVYGENNMEFKTARTFPKMVLIEVSVHDDEHVAFDAPGMRCLYVKVPNVETCDSTKIKLHKDDEIFSLDCGDEAASWISRYIYGKTTGLRIGFHDGEIKHRRDLSVKYGKYFKEYENLGNESAGLYSDLTAILLLNQASVDDLNTRIKTDTKITVENFRPNITIEGPGAPPYIEDTWEWIKIGDVVLRNVKPCTRCMLTTIDPETGIRNLDREPLNTLETYRCLNTITKAAKLEGELTVMGINLEVNKKGEIKLEDEVFVG